MSEHGINYKIEGYKNGENIYEDYYVDIFWAMTKYNELLKRYSESGEKGSYTLYIAAYSDATGLWIPMKNDVVEV